MHILKMILVIIAIQANIQLVASASENPNYIFGFDSDGHRRMSFTIPQCLPNCTASDRTQLTTSGIIENQIVEAIDGAQREIAFSQYTFSRQPIFAALLAAARRGVKIRGVVDSGQFKNIEKFCSQDPCTYPAPFDSGAYLQADISVRLQLAESSELYKAASPTEKLALLFHQLPNQSAVKSVGGNNRLVHHKFVLVDQDQLLSGSGNWSSTAVSINLENLLVFNKQLDAERVEAFACMFDAIWGEPQQRAQRTGACQTSEVFFAPVARGQNSIVDQIIQSISSAERSIDIAMHHLVHPAIIFELTRAAQRGVQIRLVTDDDHCISKISEEMKTLFAAGAEIRFIPTVCQLFQLAHNKFGVFDRRLLINGSGNWSKAGLERNLENFLVTNEERDVRPFDQAFERMWTRAETRDQCSCDPSTVSCRERYCFGSR